MIDWTGSTTVQITNTQRKRLAELQIGMMSEAGHVIPLRDVVDRVLSAGLDALGIHGMNGHAPIIAQSPALVNEQ